MEMAFWQEEFIELVLVSTRFYLVIFVRLSVCRAVYWNVEQAALNMNGCMCDKWYTLMID